MNMKVIADAIWSELFGPVRVLLDNMVLGGAIWNSRVNRDQVRDGHSILEFLIPRFINIMMAPYYPVVNN